MFNDYLMTEEDIGLFKEMIPEYCLEPLKDGSLFGMVVTNEDRMSAPLVGIVLYRFINGFIEVEWVAPSPEYSLPDYGADMVRRLLNKARIMRSVLGVRGRYRNGDRMSLFFPDDEFSKKAAERGTYRFRLSDVVNLKDDNKGRDRFCIPLSKADDGMKKSMITAFNKHGHAMPVSHPINWDIYEEDITLFYFEKDEAEGVVLIEKKGEELVIDLVFSENPVVSMILLKNAYQAAKKKYGEDHMVACPVLNEISDGLVKKIVKEPSMEEVILAEAYTPVGTGTLDDYVFFSPGSTGEKRA